MSRQLTSGVLGRKKGDVWLYKGEVWEYEEVISPYTGRIWMDRNLGASRVPTSLTDDLGYGDLFQFGKPDDFHQNRDSELTTIQSETAIPPDNNKFVYSNLSWLNIPIGITGIELWQPSDRANMPAPKGWRIPTDIEILDEINAIELDGFTRNRDGIYGSFLKMPRTGHRKYTDGLIDIWTTKLWNYNNRFDGSSRRATLIGNSVTDYGRTFNAEGCTVRLIKEI